MKLYKRNIIRLPAFVLLNIAGYFFLEDILYSLFSNVFISYSLLYIYIITISLYFQSYTFKNSISQIGLTINKSSILNSLYYGSLAFIFMIVITLFNEKLHGSLTFNSYFINILEFNFFIIIMQSTIEEIVFRGTLLQAMIKKGKNFYGILISSILFALVHTFNPNVDSISLLNIFLAGVLLSVIYIKTESILPAISFHIVWNFTQSYILGVPVSGFVSTNSMFTTFIADIKYVHLLIGDEFGFESGIICTYLLFFGISYIILRYTHKFV